MRLLAVADLHYSLPQFDWVLEVAADFEWWCWPATISSSARSSTGGRRASWCGNISAVCARRRGS